MLTTSSRDPNVWLGRIQPWVRLIAFIITVRIAGREGWSAGDLAWSFWLAGFWLGLIYLVVYQMRGYLLPSASGATAEESWGAFAGILFVFLFAYLLFAAFLSLVFSIIAWNVEGAPLSPAFSNIPDSISSAFVERWPFLLMSGISILPTYVVDALTVNFTDFSRPIFARDLLRMIILIFILVPLTLLELGVFALYAVLFVYFLPLASLRQIAGQVRGMWRHEREDART